MAMALTGIIVSAGGQFADPPQVERVAVTKIVILPDPKAPISTATPILPLYQTFATKLGSIETGVVLGRAAELALGDRAFASTELRTKRLRASIASGVEAARGRFGQGGEGRTALVEHLGRSVSAHHIARKQIVEIRVVGSDADEAAFLSWAVAEAAHQHHGARMRNATSTVRARLSAEIERAEIELATARSDERDSMALSSSRIELKGRVIALLEGQLAEEDLRLCLAEARHRLGLPPVGFQPRTLPAGFLRERRQLVFALESKRIDGLVRAQLFSSDHPDLQRLEREIRALGERLARLDQAGSALVERQLAAALEEEGRDLVLEREVLAERKAWLAERRGEWIAAIGTSRLRDERILSLEQSVASLRKVERQTQWFGEGLGSPIVLLSPAMGVFHLETDSKRGLLWISIALAIGGVLACAVALERMRDVLRGCRDVEERLGVPLLGVVSEDPALAAAPLEDGYSLEAGAGVGAIAAALCDSTAGPQRRIVAIASAEPGEGRTTVAIHLAVALARRGRRVVLVDGDLRAPAIPDRIGLPRGSGLSACLIGADGPVLTEEMLFETPIPTLDVLPSGPLAEETVPIFSAPRLGQLIATLAASYDHVIVDTPSLARAGDALAIAGAVDGVLLIAKSHCTPRVRVAEARRLLESSGGRVIGAVLSRTPGVPAAVAARAAEGLWPPLDRRPAAESGAGPRRFESESEKSLKG